MLLVSLLSLSSIFQFNLCLWSQGEYRRSLIKLYANGSQDFDQQYARVKVDLESLEIEETKESLIYGIGEIDTLRCYF